MKTKFYREIARTEQEKHDSMLKALYEKLDYSTRFEAAFSAFSLLMFEIIWEHGIQECFRLMENKQYDKIIKIGIDSGKTVKNFYYKSYNGKKITDFGEETEGTPLETMIKMFHEDIKKTSGVLKDGSNYDLPQTIHWAWIKEHWTNNCNTNCSFTSPGATSNPLGFFDILKVIKQKKYISEWGNKINWDPDKCEIIPEPYR